MTKRKVEQGVASTGCINVRCVCIHFWTYPQNFIIEFKGPDALWTEELSGRPGVCSSDAVAIMCRGASKVYSGGRGGWTAGRLLFSLSPNFILYIQVLIYLPLYVSASLCWSGCNSVNLMTTVRTWHSKNRGLVSDRVRYLSLLQSM